MKYTPTLTIMCSMILSASAICASFGQRDKYDSEKSQAEQNKRTLLGGLYDVSIGNYFNHLPKLQSALTACLKNVPSSIQFRGYFRFKSDGTYQVVMRPKGAASDCISVAFSGYSLPKPPHLPYLNDLNFYWKGW